MILCLYIVIMLFEAMLAWAHVKEWEVEHTFRAVAPSSVMAITSPFLRLLQNYSSLFFFLRKFSFKRSFYQRVIFVTLCMIAFIVLQANLFSFTITHPSFK